MVGADVEPSANLTVTPWSVLRTPVTRELRRMVTPASHQDALHAAEDAGVASGDVAEHFFLEAGAAGVYMRAMVAQIKAAEALV